MFTNTTPQETDNILTKKAALRSIWVIPSVSGVSRRLAASINSPTLLLGEYVSSETTFSPFANEETYKQNNEGCSQLPTSQFALQQQLVLITEKRVWQQQNNFRNYLTLLKSLQPASLTKDNLPPFKQKTRRWMGACIPSISSNLPLHNLESLKEMILCPVKIVFFFTVLTTVLLRTPDPDDLFQSRYLTPGFKPFSS